MKNQLLAQAEQTILSKAAPEIRADIEKAVRVGGQEAIKGGPDSILAGLKHSKDPLHDCVVGAINLAIILRKKSRNTMSVKVLVPAATILMLNALDFAELAKMVQIDKPELDQATHLLVNTLFKRIGVSPQMLQTAANKVHALTQNPVSMERMKMAAGMTKHPDAPVPTPVPASQPEPEEAE